MGAVAAIMMIAEIVPPRAEHITEEADQQIQELAAQVERLESRRAEFVTFVARELDLESEDSRESDAVDVGPLDVRFRGGSTPDERNSA